MADRPQGESAKTSVLAGRAGWGEIKKEMKDSSTRVRKRDKLKSPSVFRSKVRTVVSKPERQPHMCGNQR